MAKDKSVYDDLIDGGALTPQPDIVVLGEERNKYDDLIERQASPLLKVVTDRGMVQDPERAARILRVQGRMELPADLVERNLDQLEQSMARNDFNPEGFRKTSPVVGAWLAERPEHLAISRDDLTRMARLEQLIAVSPKYRVSPDGGITETSEDGTQGFRYANAQEFYSTTFRGREVRQQIDAGERAARVADLATLGPLANVGAGFVSSLESTTDALRSIGGQSQPAGTVTAPVSQASQDLSPGIWGDLQRGVGGLAADASLMVAGGPIVKGASTLLKLGRVRALLSTTALGTQGARAATGALLAGASVQPLAIREGINTGREHGLLNGLAAWGIETGVAGAFRRTGIQRALIPGVTPAVMAQRMGAARRFLTEAGLEGGEEIATEFVHAVHEATSGIDPDALEPDKLTRRLIVAGALGGLAGGAFNVPELVAEMSAGSGDLPGPRPALGKMPGILRGQNTKQFMQGLGEFATESEALKRSPDAVKALAAKMPETGRTTIYVDPQEFTAYAQSKQLDPRAFARLATAEFGVYEEAIATGAPMPIPVAQYVVALAGSEHHAAISAMARLSPGDPSVAESDAALETLKKPGEVVTPEQRAAAQAAATQADAGADSLDDSALRIHEDVAKQLEAVGFTPEDAQVQATLYSEGFKTLGERTGKDPFALYEPYRLKITRELPGVVQKGTADYTDTLLDRLRSGDIPKESAGRGESLGDYLRRKGGLQDQGGELSALAVDAGRKPGKSNLIQASGRALDAAAQDAAEAGYIESPEPQALLDAIREEAAGRPVYMASAGDSQEQAIRDGLLELQEYLGRLGVDLKAMDNPMVKKLLKEQEATGGDGQTLNQGADLSHLSPEARAYVESLSAEPAAVLDAIAASVAYLRIHPDLTGDKGNLQMVADFAKRRATKGGRAVTLNQILESGGLAWGIGGSRLAAGGDSQGGSKAVVPQSLVKTAGLSPELLRDLFVGEAMSPEGDRLLSVPSLPAMLAHVRRAALNDPKILDAIVGAVPIDVVNNLFGSEAAAKVALHNEPMFKDGATFDANLPIPQSVDAASPIGLLLGEVARKATEAPRVSSAAGGEPSIQDPALIAGDGNRLVHFFHKDSNKARAKIEIGSDRSLSITLLRSANRSSFLHETGHLYLEVLGDLATAPDAAPEITAMWADVLKWLGVSKRSEIGTPQHEQWAEGFETYLMRGTAPSTALGSAFARFRSWLMSIYKKLTSMRVQLSPEITRVFDRVLASDEAIATAQARQGTPPTFKTAADAGMTPEQFTAYQASVEAARVNAEDRLRAQLMASYEREATKQWKEERDALLATTADEINFRGEYQAIAAFQDGTLPDGRRLPDDLQGLRLSRQEIVDTYGEAALLRLPGPKGAKRVNPNNSGRYIYGDNGISLAAGAKMFGFRDGQALFDALVNAPDRETLIEQTADKIMAETHPDPLTDGTLDERAALAMHNDLSAEVMISELRSLSQRTGQQAAPLELLRETARGLIARKLVKNLRPHRYEVAEGVAFRRVEEALAKGDHREAFIQKQKQLLNHELFRAAQQAVDTSTKAYDYFKTFVEPKTRARIGKAGGWEWTVTHPDGATVTVDDEAQAIALVKAKGGEWDQTSSYLDQIDGLLAQYEFKREAIKAAKRRDSLRAWIEKQGNDGSTVAIAPSLLDQSKIINWKEMTVDQIAELKDAIQSIAHLATWKNKLMKAADQADFDEQRDAALVQLATLPQRKPAPRSGNATGLDAIGEKLDHLLANHRKLSSYARQMDGGEAGGTWWNLLVRPLNEAGDQEVIMRAEAAAAVKDLWTAWRKDGRHIKQVVTVPGVGPMTLETRLAVALNWGNAGNKERLLEGENWTAVQGQAVIDTLDATDWAVVQGTWDHINSYWSQIRSLEKRMNGVAPDKVEGTPFIVQPKSPDGVAKGDPVVMRGGYYPVKYDHKRGARSGSQMQGTEALYELGGATAATTRRGHTKERTVGTGKPLRLDIDVIGQHVAQVVHDLTHREAVRDLRKVMLDDAVRQGILGTLGKGALDMIDGTIRDVAVSDLADTATDQVYRKLRGGASIATMGFNFTSAAMQVTGVGQSMQLVGIGPFLRASGLVASNPADASRLINEQSSFMANRSKTALREVSEVMNQVKGGAWRDTMTRYAYMMMQECQRMVDMPTWLAAKENALIAGKSEVDARAIADQAVIDSQGSGMTKDLAGVQRSRGPVQLFTVYYSYLGVTFQRLAESYATARGATSAPEAVIQLMRDHLLLISIPAVLGVMIRSATKGGGDDEDKERPSLTARMLKEHIGMLTGTLTGVREFSDTIGTLAVTATLGKDEAKKFPVYGYGGPAGIMGLEAASTLLVQANQAEWDAGLAKAALRVAGVFGRLPTGQFTKTMGGLLDEEGPDLRSLLFGPPP